MQIALREEVYTIVGAAIEVHKELGPGFLEAVYQEAMEHELGHRGIAFTSQEPLKIKYKGQELASHYYADLLCFGQIIVELKALNRLSGQEEAQVLNYLKATGLKVGLLVNFGSHGRLEWKRLVM